MKKPSAEKLDKALNDVLKAFSTCDFKWTYGISGVSQVKNLCKKYGLIYVGVGCTRAVVSHRLTPSVVFKVENLDWDENDGKGAVNKSEKKVWEAIKDTPLRKYFAEVVMLSGCGRVSVMERVKGMELSELETRHVHKSTKDKEGVVWNLRDRMYSLPCEAENSCGLTINDLHDSNIMVKPIFGGKRFVFKAVDYGGAYRRFFHS